MISLFYETNFQVYNTTGDKMSIMTQLEFELDFSQSEKEIARYILNNGEDILSMPIKTLAQRHIHLLQQ